MTIDARAWIEGGVRAEDWLARTLRSSADVREVSVDQEARTVTVWMQSGYRFVVIAEGAVGAFRLSVGAGDA